MKAHEIDFADAHALAIAATGNKSLTPAEAIAFALAHQDQIGGIFAFLKNLFGHHKDPANVPAPTPPVIPVVVPVPVPPVPVSGQVHLTGLRGDNHDGLYFIEEHQSSQSGSAKVVDIERFKEILAGNQVTRGASIHFNFSPLDERGQEIRTGDPRHALINGGAPYIEYQIRVGDETSDWVSEAAEIGGLELHQWDTQFGCVPRIKVPMSLTDSNHRELSIRARVKTQPSIESGWTPVIYVP